MYQFKVLLNKRQLNSLVTVAKCLFVMTLLSKGYHIFAYATVVA